MILTHKSKMMCGEFLLVDIGKLPNEVKFYCSLCMWLILWLLPCIAMYVDPEDFAAPQQVIWERFDSPSIDIKASIAITSWIKVELAFS